MKSTNKTGLIIFICISVLAVAFGVIALLYPKTETKRPGNSGGVNINLPGFSFSAGKQGVKKAFKNNDYIAKLFIDGIIVDETKSYNQKWILETIKDLAEDNHNQGIMLCLNTPGGGVYQSDEVYLALLDYKKTTERPVYAYITQLAASGGYYIACAADKIYGNRNGLTGSIGVIFGQSVDATEMLGKIGIKTKTFHAGKNKNMLSYDEPLTEEQESIMQTIAEEAYNQFTQIVSEGRNMPIEKVRKIADGRIYSTLQAKNNGLIDDVCTFDEAVDHLFKDFELSEDIDVEDYEYEFTDTLSSWLGNILTRVTGTGAFAKRLETANIPFPAYYYNW